MTYANGRICHDADSHTMETADWIMPYLDEEHAKSIGLLYSKGSAGKRILGLIEAARGRQTDAEADAKAAEDPIRGAKGWSGYGAFDPAERSRALDQLGFSSQLVFPTFVLGLATRAADDDTRYLAVRAVNKAQIAFCANDPRLIAVAYCPFEDPKRALEELEFAIGAGAGAIMVSAAPVGGRSPGHPDYDPFWARLEKSNIPFMLHIGPGTKVQPKDFHNNGRERAPDLHGGGENLRFADYLCLPYAPQIYLTAMVYDGVFQRFPALRGGVIESGAGWVPDFLRQLDLGYKSFRKTDPYLQSFDMKPSEYIRRAVKFTPFPDEDVGVMIRDAGPDLFLFSSDYPHPEGTSDPMGRFERALGDLDEGVRDHFYRTNYEAMMGGRVPAMAMAAE